MGKNNYRFKLKAKKAERCDTYFVYGRNACIACLKNHKRKILAVYIESGKRELEGHVPDEFQQILKFKSKDELNILSGGNNGKHQGIVIQVGRYNFPKLGGAKFLKEENQCVFLLDGVTDPHNVGAILRSAFCFGIKNILMNKGCDDITSAVVRSSAGYSEEVNIYKLGNLSENLSELKKNGFSIVTLDNNKEVVDLKEVLKKSRKLVFVFGSEGYGISKQIIDVCDLSVKIPMIKSAESLNVSNTVAIVGYEVFSARSLVDN